MISVLHLHCTWYHCITSTCINWVCVHEIHLHSRWLSCLSYLNLLCIKYKLFVYVSKIFMISSDVIFSRFWRDVVLMWSDICKIWQLFVIMIDHNIICRSCAKSGFLFSDSLNFLHAINLLHLQIKLLLFADLWMNMHIFHHWLTFKYDDYQRHHRDALYNFVSTHL